ncbi:MAG: peptide chain release factor aRF-1 [Candidatus Pacearchaeota archaeon]
MSISLYELESILEELNKIKGRHTELISVLIPAGANIHIVADQLEAEKSTADNIKSKTTRKNVIDALESIIRELKLYKKTPDNGLAIYCGNISETEGQNNIKLWAIEPPQPLKVRLYRCDKEFVIQPLKEMLEAKEVYGLVVLDRKEATFGLLEGKQIKILRKITSGVPSKIRAGGQSAQRFHRITEGLAKEFFRRIADTMKELYLNIPNLKGIMIGGPIPTKEDFLKEGQLITSLKEKIIAVKDLGYADEHGIELLVESSKDVIAEQEITKEKKLVESFFEMIGKGKKAIYGKENIYKAINYGAVDTLLLSKKLKKEEIIEMQKKAESISAKIEIISTETEEGEQFYNLTKGYGAILRFDIQ